MSLKVWLPLIKDTQNYGLMELPVPWAVWSKNEGGKIGQYCYSDCAIYHKDEEWLDNKWSLSCWVKSSNWGTYNDILMCKNTNESTQSQFYFSIIGGTTLNLGTNGGSGGVSYNYTFSTNTWYHVVATYDGTIACLYINGDKVKTQSYSTAKLNGMNNFCIGCRSSNATGTSATGNGSKKFNDVRVYDHALSPLEVKHIAQGLILHYPLNRGGWGNDNILINSNFDLHYTQSSGWDTTKNGTQLASSWGGYNGGVPNPSTVYHAHLKELNGEWVYEYIKTASETWLGISQGGLNSKLTAGKTYTFSWEQYCVSGSNYAQTGLYYFKTGATSANFHLGLIYGNVNRELGKWQKFSRTFIAPEDGDYSKNMSWYIYGHSGNGIIYVRHPKLEEGNTATPWSPSPLDTLATTMGLNDNVEYDVSGYCNNGTRTGTFSWTSDTPRYNVSTSFNGSAKIERDSLMGEVYTLSCWAKTIKNKSTSQMMVVDSNSEMSISFYNGTIIGVYGTTRSTGSKCTLSGSNYKENEWNHFVVVKTSNDGKRNIYCNGEPLTPSSDDYWSSTSNNFVIGARNTSTPYYFYGEISDVRIYATALSAEDIKDLYELGATIDTNGVLSTYEFTEQ